jgi:hypothetical protein
MEIPNSGKSRGGKARADSLSSERKREIAKKAAIARHNPEAQRTEKTGVLNIGGLKIPCYVLNDGTRLLSQRGLNKALGRPEGGKGGAEKLPKSLGVKSLTPFISNDLTSRIANTISVVPPRSGNPVKGIDANCLPEICDVWLRAREAGALSPAQLETAKKAEILTRGLAHVGIIALVDEATGYQEIRPKDALQKYLEMLIRKELAAWAKKFPDEFYENIYKLKGWIWPGMGKNRFSVVGIYTRDLVFERIAPGLLHELENKSPKDERGNRKNKLHQWLTEDVGNPLLAQHLHSLIMFQRLALSNGYGWNRFVKMVDQVLPKKGTTLELPFDQLSTDS